MKTQNVYQLKQAELSIDPKFLLIVFFILFLGFFTLKANAKTLKEEKLKKEFRIESAFSYKKI